MPPLVFGLVDFVRMARLSRSRPKARARGRKSNASSGISTTRCGTASSPKTGPEGDHADTGSDRHHRGLDRRGILNSIASKNDPASRGKRSNGLGCSTTSSRLEIGWGPKSEAIRQIATALDIGMDTLVFIDDQSFERGEVADALSGRRGYPQSAIAELFTLERFVRPLTSRGIQATIDVSDRRAAEARARPIAAGLRRLPALVRHQIGGAAAGPDYVRRVFELSQRTNQLNISARRYTIEDIESLLKSVRCEERLCSELYRPFRRLWRSSAFA